jgi:hypothetical protein
MIELQVFFLSILKQCISNIFTERDTLCENTDFIIPTILIEQL